MSDESKAEQTHEPRTFSEEMSVTGSQLGGIVRRLIKEGNVRRIVIRYADNEVMIEIPLPVGVALGGGMALFNPGMAFLTGLAAVLVRVKIEVVRVTDENDT